MVVIVHGYEGSGPGHWQRWLHDELKGLAQPVLFPELPHPTAPEKDAWVDTLSRILDQRGTSPITFVCHSLGCWAVDHLVARRGSDGIHAALLVAPPSPLLPIEALDSFMPPPCDRAAWGPLSPKSRVVGSDNDDFATEREIRGIATSLGLDCQILPGAGHINADAGFGPFPLAMVWLRETGSI